MLVIDKVSSANNELNRLSFKTCQGDRVGVLCSSTSERLTLLKVLAGLMKPREGQVLIDGHSSARKRKKVLASVYSYISLYPWLSLEQNIKFWLAINGGNIELYRHFARRFIMLKDCSSKITELTQEQKYLINLCLGLASEKKLLLLDEPMGSLSIESYVQFCELIKNLDEKEYTIVLLTQDLGLVRDLCQKVVIINNGEVLTERDVNNLYPFFDAYFYRVVLNALPEKEVIVSITKALAGLDIIITEDFSDGLEVLIKLKNSYDLYTVTKILEEQHVSIKMLEQYWNMDKIMRFLSRRGQDSEDNSSGY